jgi:EAL domain-containing protein (putative c-di-GMP-specific phosphodiesterase class I)/ActR/RegA family two-component response regulator
VTRTVLVVDDDPLVLRSVSRMLRRDGYEVREAPDVDSALAIAATEHVDAAVVDYALSHETGMTVLSKLRDVQPSCIRILITGRSNGNVIVDAINRGEVVKVIKKPFPSAELLTALDEAFESAARMRLVAKETDAAEAEAERRALEQAVRPELLQLALQPILDVGSAGPPRPVAYEALLRPRHERLSSPLTLLASAEQHDRVLEVGSAVLGLAIGCFHRVPDDAALFVNLHPAQLGSPERLAADLLALQPYAHRVTLEITERSRLQDIDCWEESVRVITQAGFSIAVDDLGAGYSSLGMLADLHPQYIKLDMSLVRNIDREPRKQRLVSLVQTFGEATATRVIAEGVETGAELLALRDCGIELMQGYYFARPSLA